MTEFVKSKINSITTFSPIQHALPFECMRSFVAWLIQEISKEPWHRFEKKGNLHRWSGLPHFSLFLTGPQIHLGETFHSTYFDFCLFHGLNHKRNCCLLRFFLHRTLQHMFPSSLTEAHHCILSEIYKNSILKMEMPIGCHWQDKRDYFRPLPQKKLYGHDPQTVTNPNM